MSYDFTYDIFTSPDRRQMLREDERAVRERLQTCTHQHGTYVVQGVKRCRSCGERL